MPTFTGKAFANFYKNLLGISQTGNTGVDVTTRNVQDGAGNNTSISLSDDQLTVKPQNDNTTATLRVNNAEGNSILSVDTNSSRVLTGSSQVEATTQYAQFGLSSSDTSLSEDMLADTHYMIPFGGAFRGSANDAYYMIGSATDEEFNDTDPADSLTISTTAASVARCYWYVMDNITIEAVKWLFAGDAGLGDVAAGYLMGYTVDTSNSSTSGDLSSGTKLASSVEITGLGLEQIYYNSMTMHSANVDAGDVILFTFAIDGTSSDYTINSTVKYHIR